jgi:hypothetical protein
VRARSHGWSAARRGPACRTDSPPPAIAALLAYTVFVGASASVVRAAIMGILVILAQRLGRDAGPRALRRAADGAEVGVVGEK